MRRPKTSTVSAPGSIHGSSRHLPHSSSSSSIPVYRSGWGRHAHGIDIEKVSMAMEKGHKVCKLLLLKRWEPAYKKLSLNRETRQLVLSKWDTNSIRSSGTQTLDLRLVKEVQTVDYKVNKMNIEDKWKKDKEIKRLDSEMILVISYGTSFVLSHWIILCKSIRLFPS